MIDESSTRQTARAAILLHSCATSVLAQEDPELSNEGSTTGRARAGKARPDRNEGNAAFSRDDQRNRKRSALLQEAARLINARGIAAVSLEDVAASLGISKAAVYYYFSGKQEILLECYELSFAVWEAALDDAALRGKNGLEKVEFFVRKYLEDGLESLHPLILVREQGALDSSSQQTVERRRRSLRNRLRAFLVEGAKDGSMKDVHPKIASTMIGANISWLLRNYQAEGALSKAEYIDEAMKILLGGVRA
jgi:TetR/AcrR family transcriptional regulator